MVSKKEIKPEEVSRVLRSAISGEVTAGSLSDINWWDVNEPDVNIGGWVFKLFIEANWIYDIYDVYAPDGRISEFSPKNNDSAIELFLTKYEVAQLCKLLGCPITSEEIERFNTDDR